MLGRQDLSCMYLAHHELEICYHYSYYSYSCYYYHYYYYYYDRCCIVTTITIIIIIIVTHHYLSLSWLLLL